MIFFLKSSVKIGQIVENQKRIGSFSENELVTGKNAIWKSCLRNM